MPRGIDRSSYLYVIGTKVLARKAELRLRWVDVEEMTGSSTSALMAYVRLERTAPPEVIAKLEEVLQLAAGSLTDPDQGAAKKRAIGHQLEKLKAQMQSIP